MNSEEVRSRFPATSYFREAAKRRIPHFAWEYLDAGTGVEAALARNHSALDAVLLTPRFMGGFQLPELETEIFSSCWRAPVGVAPVGLAGMMWPGCEIMLARMATSRNLPFCLSMMACETPATVGPHTGGRGWFQHYPFADREAEEDILRRAAASGFETLMVTVDVPVNSTRERQRKAGVTGSARMSVSRLRQVLSCPSWTVATARRGKPSLRIIEKYVADSSIEKILDFVAGRQMGAVDLDHLKRLRDFWKGPFVVKGIMDAESASVCARLGADGVVVSNHGARQLDAVQASIDVLPGIASECSGKLAVMFDSGVRTGLDVARAIALGAQMVFAGRAFMYAVCAAGEEGAGAAADNLVEDLANNMMQLGAHLPSQLPDYLAYPGFGAGTGP